MKALVTTHDSLAPVFGGGALRTLLIAKDLQRRGWEVVLLGPSETEVIDGMKVYPFPAPTKKRSQILSSLKFNFRLLTRGLRAIPGADLVFVHNTIAMPAAGFLAKLLGKRLVLDVTDLHAEYLRIGKITALERALTPLITWMEYFLVDLADRIVVVTEIMKQQLVAHGIDAAKIAVVYDGVALDRFASEKSPAGRYRVAHIGLIDKQHGVEFLIRAIPHIVAEQPQARFDIVGDGREAAAVRALSVELGVDKYCTFYGFQPHEKMSGYLKECAVGIIPRPDTLANHLVVTLKLLEYWATGTVVVAARLRGIQEIAREDQNILFFTPGDPQDLAAKLLAVWKDPEQMARLRQGSLDMAQRLQWSNLIPGLVDFCLAK